MTVLVDTRADLDLVAVRRVAWDGEPVALAEAVAPRLADTHAAFGRYVAARLAEDPDVLLYGVTTGPGDKGTQPLGAADAEAAVRPLLTASTFGPALPERVTRAIALARLANLVDGHAAVRPVVAEAVAGLLGGGPLPPVPAYGNGGAGEILALGHLFAGVADRAALEPRERMALVNGSPCAAALVADAALAGRRRLDLAEDVLALSAHALRAPVDAFSPDLAALWNDAHQAAALEALTTRLAGATGSRLAHQAPVSHRVLPRVLGRVRGTLAAAEATATSALAAVTDNPVFLPPAADRPLGAFVSNGGFHEDRAHPALDAVAHAWADLAQVAQRHVDQLFQHPATAPALAPETGLKTLHMVAAGIAEDARQHASTTHLGAGGFGQNDLPSPAFAAWGKADATGASLDQVLAVLAVLASQVLDVTGQDAPPALASALAEVRDVVPPVREAQAAGAALGRLADRFRQRVVPAV